MDPVRRLNLKRPLIASLLAMAGISASQLIAGSGPSLFGKSVTGLAAGVIAYYPGIAVGEFFKLHLIVFVLIFCALSWCQFVHRLLRFTNAEARANYFALLMAWVAVFFASVLQYPALYEERIPASILRIVRASAWVTSPGALQSLAMILGATPLFWVIAKRAWRGDLKSNRRLMRHAVLPLLVGTGLVSGDATIGSLGASGDTSSAPDRPHVLFIAVDSLRADRAANAAITPAINQLKNDPSTITFLDHIVGIPRTFPSWIEMIQGRYSANTTIRHMFPGFAQRDGVFSGMVTAAQSAGYATAVFSDFAGDIFPRFNAGFEHIDAPAMTLGNMIRQSVLLMFPLYLPVVTSNSMQQQFSYLKTAAMYSDPVHLVSHLQEYVTKQHAFMPANGPKMFNAVFFSTAHFPYASPYPYYTMYADRDYNGNFLFQKNPEITGGAPELTTADKKQINALYDGAVRSVDDALGQLFNWMKQHGLWDKTIIVLTADHGEDLYDDDKLQGHGDHLRGEHVLKVPLYIKLAGKTPVQREVQRISRAVDIFPTLAALAGWHGTSESEESSKSQPLDGIDQLASAAADPAEEPAAYAETEIWFSRAGGGHHQSQRLDYPGISSLLTFDPGYSGEIILNPKYENIMVSSRHRALLTKRWKLIYLPTAKGIAWELFDRQADPANLHNLVDREPQVFEVLQKRLMAQIQSMEPHARLIGGYVVPR